MAVTMNELELWSLTAKPNDVLVYGTSEDFYRHLISKETDDEAREADIRTQRNVRSDARAVKKQAWNLAVTGWFLLFQKRITSTTYAYVIQRRATQDPVPVIKVALIDMSTNLPLHE